MEIALNTEEVLEFVKIFPDDDSCREFIAKEKWKDGYKCKRCENSKYVYFEKHNKRECTKCRYNESPTAGTLFHRVKFGIQKAFCIVFEMACTDQAVSSINIAKRYEITQKTAWLFIQKVKLAIKVSKKKTMNDKLQINEFVIGGLETNERNFRGKKIAVCDISMTGEGEIDEAIRMLLLIILEGR